MGTFITFILISIMISVVVMLNWDEQMKIWNRKKNNPFYEKKSFGEINKYDAFLKCQKVIESCKTKKQWEVASNIPWLFYNLYDDNYLYDCLKQEADDQLKVVLV